MFAAARFSRMLILMVRRLLLPSVVAIVLAAGGFSVFWTESAAGDVVTERLASSSAEKGGGSGISLLPARGEKVADRPDEGRSLRLLKDEGLPLTLALSPQAGRGDDRAATEPSASLSEPRTDLSETDLARVTSVTQPTTDFSRAEPFEAMSGGAATSIAPVNKDIFSQFSANISFEEEETFRLGNALFRKLWVSSPSSTQASD